MSDGDPSVVTGASSRDGQPRHVKIVHAGGVAAGDLGLFVLRHPARIFRDWGKVDSVQLMATTGYVESPGGVSPPGAPRSVREPLDSYGSRCSAVSMAEPPVGKERWICSA